jgi:hypothetical protein
MLDIIRVFEIRKTLKASEGTEKFIGLDLGQGVLFPARILSVGFTVFTWEWYSDDNQTYISTQQSSVEDIDSITLHAVDWSRVQAIGLGNDTHSLWVTDAFQDDDIIEDDDDDE